MTFSRKNNVVLIMVMVLLIIAGVLGGQVSFNFKSSFAASSSDYDVKAYGAMGDGNADDTTAIQNAINAAQSAGGGVVFFPKGRYKISSTLTITGHNVQLEGTGNSSVVYLNKSTDAVIKIGHASDLNQSTNNKVKNLTIDRSVQPNTDFVNYPSYGIQVIRARYITIDGVSVYNAAHGIAVGLKTSAEAIPTQHIYIINSFIKKGSTMGFDSFVDSNVIFWNSADIGMVNTFVEPTNRGIVMAGNSNGISLSNVSVINGGSFNYGIVMEGTGFARYVNNAIIENALHQQIYIGPNTWGVTIANSWLGAGDSNGTTRTGILIQSGAHKITISNNLIRGQRREGIVAFNPTDTVIANNILENNVTSACSGCDSLKVDGGTNVVITGNRVSSPNDRYGVFLTGSLNNYIYGNNDTSLSGTGYFNSATGGTKAISNNLN